MANNCLLDFHIVFNSNDDKQKFIWFFESKIQDKVIEIADGKYLFDIFLDSQCENVVTISGWVKWSFNRDELKEFINEFILDYGVVSMECLYEETSCLIYGQYIYSRKELYDCYIPEESPIWEEADEDCFYDKLNAALEKEAVKELIARD